MGALGIGGAGVARTYDAYAPYWNPAGLAFADHAFTSRFDGSVGLKVNEGLADNVDRLSGIQFDSINRITPGSPSPTVVTDTIRTITILNDIKAKNGTLAVNGNTALAFQYKHFAFGAFGTFEGFAQSKPDTSNILPSSGATGNPVSPADFAEQVQNSPQSNQFFSVQQRSDIATALQANGFTPQQANDLINATDASNVNSDLSPREVTNSMINSLAPAFGAGAATLLDNNTTAVLTRSLVSLEFPFSYGHPLRLGEYGTLGIGATAKIIAGRVYQTQTFLLKSGTTVTSGDITKELTTTYRDSVNLGVDLGLLWRYGQWLNVGIVAKNLNSPEFDAPDLKDKNGTVLAGSGGVVRLQPQVRLGVAFDPVKWLTLAADLDLTENETVVAADNFRSRHLGGGFEWHSLSWFKVRGGMYSNIADQGIGPTATAGLTFGGKRINADLDAAYGFETAKYKGHSYPQEARVQLQVNCLF
jgi:F plasmid transfer operon, TraF, protein